MYGHFGVAQALAQLRLHRVERIVHGHVERHADADGQRVDKDADQVLQLRRVANQQTWCAACAGLRTVTACCLNLQLACAEARKRLQARDAKASKRATKKKR